MLDRFKLRCVLQNIYRENDIKWKSKFIHNSKKALKIKRKNDGTDYGEFKCSD